MSHTAFDSANMFCTRTDIERCAGRYFTEDSTPTDEEVSDFAEAVRAELVMLSDKAGNKLTPPADDIGDVQERDAMREANAVGTAYRAWRTIASSGDSAAADMRDALRIDWLLWVGDTDLGGDNEGRIMSLLSSSADTDVMNNDLEAGDTALEATSTRTVTPEFSMEDEE